MSDRKERLKAERLETKKNKKIKLLGDYPRRRDAIQSGGGLYLGVECKYGRVLWRTATTSGATRKTKCPCIRCQEDAMVSRRKENRRNRSRYRSDQDYKDYMVAYAARREKRTRGYQRRCELTDFAMKESISLAREREGQTGFEWHVDHMIPLKAVSVSGLHHWSNLQVIPARMNREKSNRMIYTEPFEWLKDA